MPDEHASHHANYRLIFGVLCFCTAMSWAFDKLNIENRVILIVLVMGVAMAKALFVMAYFMHLKFEGNWKFVLLGPTVALAMGLPLALLPDIGVHYYTNDVPQMHDVVTAHGEETGETGEKAKTPHQAD